MKVDQDLVRSIYGMWPGKKTFYKINFSVSTSGN